MSRPAWWCRISPVSGLIVIAAITCGHRVADWGQTGMKAVRTIVVLVAVALTMHLHGAWTHDSSYDDFEAMTLVTASVSAVGEPYRTASFTFRCTDGGTDDSRKLDAYFTFDYFNRAGADDAPLRVKFGDDPPHDWEVKDISEGRRGLIIVNAQSQVEKLVDAPSFKAHLAYNDEVGPPTIDFSMEGARAAIGHVLESNCAACGVRRLRSEA